MKQSLVANMQHQSAHWIHCEDCGAYGKHVTWGEPEDVAWNTRPLEDALLTRAERAESSLAKWREIAKRMFDVLDDLVIAYEDEPGFKQKIVDAYRALLNEESGE